MDLSISTFQRIAIIVTFVLYTLAVVGVALYAKRKMDQSSVNSYVEDFYTGGRGMGMLAVAFMIAAGLCGAGTFVGSPGMSWQAAIEDTAAVSGTAVQDFAALCRQYGQCGTSIPTSSPSALAGSVAV